MTISAQRIVVRYGMSQEVPAMDIAEMGWDTDLHRLRVGDGSTTPTIIMTNKSLGPFEYNYIDYVQYPEIRMLPDGTVDGVDISDLNAANGFVVRRGDNLWAHRTFTNSDGWLTWTNPAGLANNPIINLSQALVTRLDNFLSEVAVDDVTIHGNGRPEAPLYAHVANETEKGVVELATSAETITGIDGTRAVTPAGLNARTSTEARTGLIKLATLSDVLNGIGTATAVSPNYLHQRTSTFTRTGLIRKATLAEVRAGTDTDSVVVPAYLKAYGDDIKEEFNEAISNIGQFSAWRRTGTLFTLPSGANVESTQTIDVTGQKGLHLVATSGEGRAVYINGTACVRNVLTGMDGTGAQSQGHQYATAICHAFRDSDDNWWAEQSSGVNIGIRNYINVGSGDTITVKEVVTIYRMALIKM